MIDFFKQTGFHSIYYATFTKMLGPILFLSLFPCYQINDKTNARCCSLHLTFMVKMINLTNNKDNKRKNIIMIWLCVIYPTFKLNL